MSNRIQELVNDQHLRISDIPPVSSREYWMRKFETEAPRAELQTDFPRLLNYQYNEAKLKFPFSKNFTDSLSRFSKQHNTQFETTIFTALNVLLFRYTYVDDLVTGFTHPGKNRLSEDMLLVIRTDLSGDPSFSTLLQKVNDEVATAQSNATIDINKIKELIHFDEKGHPFQSCFNFYNHGIDKQDGTYTQDLPVIDKITDTRTDLALSIDLYSDRLTGTWEYNSCLFETQTIERISRHFRILLEAIVSNPAEAISKLPLISYDERLQILFEWNNTASPYPAEKCMHHLFEEQVARTPAAIAVKLFGDINNFKGAVKQELNYEELNAKANQLARYLQDKGVGPEVLVGVCMTRSVEMMMSILAILKAGGAYVPMDPAYPSHRLSFMLEDSGVPVVLTQKHLLVQLHNINTEIICVDGDWQKIAGYNNDNLPGEVHAGNLAYVIYTSGSTGTPKGTLITHRAVVNYLYWACDNYALSYGTGAPVNSSIAFDATITSFFTPLLAGKQVLLLPEIEELEALSNALSANQNFSLVKITPSHLEILQHLLSPDQLKGQANALIIGGEALQSPNLEIWRANAPATRLINEYGPTETVVGCCVYEIARKGELPHEIPVGRPIANTQMYILDRHMQPVPVGVTGEIYIGGAGIARGYHNRPELTAERFIQNPFSDDGQSRLYKTGDLGRFKMDGNIIFLGRSDQQVKIRGYRIELGEPEGVLSRHPGIKSNIVIATKDNITTQRLIAYIVPRYEPAPSEDILRKFLSDRLPAYMIPAEFVVLQSIPLTANGKLDRSKLPRPEYKEEVAENVCDKPLNDYEARIKTIFEETLKLSPIGIHDDFFRLGGSSIAVAALFSRIRKVFGKKFPLSTLLNAPTVSRLAMLIQQEEKIADKWTCLIPIKPGGQRPPLFCIHGGWGQVLFYSHLANHLNADQPLYGLQAKGLNLVDKPFTRVEDMAAHYISELRTVQPEGPYALAGYCFGAIVAFEMAQQLTRDGHEVAYLASFNGIAPIKALAKNEYYASKFFLGKMRESIKTSRHAGMKARILNPLRVLKQEMRTVIDSTLYWLMSKVRIAYCKTCLPLKIRISDKMGRFYIIDALYIAQQNYEPLTYPGSMKIFRSPAIYPDPHLGWSNLLKGGIETFDVQGQHANRTVIMYEPFIGSISEQVTKDLSMLSTTQSRLQAT